jgi:hypothetical protein
MPTPLAGTPVAAPITKAVAKRVRRRPEGDEPPPKRCATSCEGQIPEIGTPKRFVKLYILKNILTIEGDQNLTAYSDELTELKSMTIWKKNVQGYTGSGSKCTMAMATPRESRCCSSPPRNTVDGVPSRKARARTDASSIATNAYTRQQQQDKLDQCVRECVLISAG